MFRTEADDRDNGGPNPASASSRHFEVEEIMKKFTTMLMVGISAVMLQGNALAQTDDPETTGVASEALVADSALELCLKRCSEVNVCIRPHRPFGGPHGQPGAMARYFACLERKNNCEAHCYRLFD